MASCRGWAGIRPRVLFKVMRSASFTILEGPVREPRSPKPKTPLARRSAVAGEARASKRREIPQRPARAGRTGTLHLARLSSDPEKSHRPHRSGSRRRLPHFPARGKWRSATGCTRAYRSSAGRLLFDFLKRLNPREHPKMPLFEVLATGIPQLIQDPGTGPITRTRAQRRDPSRGAEARDPFANHRAA